MALDIVAQDIIIDETTGPQDDDIVVPPPPLNPTLAYLLSRDDPATGLTSPEVAFQTNFVVASASAGENITSVILAQNSSGTAFSTTVGVNSLIKTVDGNYVWLFQDLTHSNVVIGVIGTSDPSAAPAATGPLAFSFGLNPTSATNADLYLVQYVPLFHPNPANPDDQIDLTNKVFASVTGTTVANFSGQNAAPGNHDFYVINSANDASKQILVTGFLGANNATANVSTQGFGVNNQSINPTETLQVDFVTGGTLAAGTAAQIQYASHIETITKAGFTINQITPSNPNLRVDVKISAFNVQGNEQGSDFYNGSPTNSVDITSIKLTGTSGFASVITADGTYATASGNVTVTGLSGTGNIVTITGLDNVTTVDITTGSPMDRLTVTGVDSNEGCDITEFHFSSTTPNAYTEEVGSFINFDDDGPTISTTGTEPTLIVDETVLATDATQSFAANFNSAFGADGAGTLTYALGITAGSTGIVDTATGEAVVLSVNGSGVVEGRTATTSVLVFTVAVDATGSITLDQLRAVVHPTADPDESTTLAADNLVKLTATITDKDGDHQSATLDIGTDLVFKDDGPTISTTGTEPALTVDETVLATDATQSFAANFNSAFGADGAGTLTYALGITAGATGIVDTATGEAVVLSVNGSGVVEGRTVTTSVLVFTVAVGATGSVTLDQLRAVVHPTADPDESTSLAADNLVQLTATITDKDGDHQSATLDIGQNLIFKDDGPSISTSGNEPTLTVDETALGPDATQSFVANFSSAFGADGAGTITYALAFNAGPTGLVDTLTGEAVVLSLNGTVLEGRTAGTSDLVFTVSVDAAGSATLDQIRAVVHANASDPDDSTTLAADNLVQLTATITDKDGDHQSATLDIGTNLVFKDDGPTIIKPFDADPGPAGIQTPETLHNVVGVPATGDFKFNIGADGRLVYDATHSDFGDADLVTAGIQRLVLTGTVDNAANPNITNVVTSLTSESATSATFAFSFHYDKDPITAGPQDATAGGTLTFDKVAGTYSIVLDDVVDGFNFSVFHSSELLQKAPPGNTGHPELVVTELDANNGTTDTDGFYVQFTANSNPSGSPFGFNDSGDGAPSTPGNPPILDTTFTAGDFVTSKFEDWVSATQSTNGVAGDTIQKGELLTLRFFNENILGDVNPGAPGGGTEKIAPTDAVDAIAIKFDGIGNSEDLIVVLDLIDYGANGVLGGGDDVETTKSIYVQNADFFKGNTVPAPYSSEFTLDQNDALVIIESNDYNTATEHYQIQGMQIMQSGNGLNGSAINLNRVTDNPGTVGVEGSSTGAATGTGGGALQAWEGTDNDVLKITDIGFIESTSGQIGAHLDFAVNVQDGDGDTTGVQHLLVDTIA